ncbi:MAG: hypothetical protein ACI9ZT_001253 [Gammaproteobacteria bacterium]|jgi:hypothetical protein
MNIVNFILYQAAWFVTIFSAAYGEPTIGVLFTMLWMLFHLSFVVIKTKNELMLIGAAIIIGCLFESGLVLSGFISYPELTALVTPAPIWMIALWVNLAATINYSMSWMKGRYFTTAILGAIAGPLAYLAGERFGAIILHDMSSVVAVSLMWLVSMPLLIWSSHLITHNKTLGMQLISNEAD